MVSFQYFSVSVPQLYPYGKKDQLFHVFRFMGLRPRRSHHPIFPKKQSHKNDVPTRQNPPVITVTYCHFTNYHFKSLNISKNRRKAVGVCPNCALGYRELSKNISKILVKIKGGKWPKDL